MKTMNRRSTHVVLLTATAMAGALMLQSASARTWFFDACGTVTVNGVPTSNVVVTAWGCEDEVVSNDVVFAHAVSDGQASNNYHVVYEIEVGEPGGSRAIDAYLVFSYQDCDPVIIECETIHELNSIYGGKIEDLNVNIECDPKGGGGHTPGFWQNKNGQALITEDDIDMLNECCLRNDDGTDADFEDKSEFKQWIKQRRATNMAYQLSGQLAAMKLNVSVGFVDGGALVYIGSEGDMISINDLIEAADEALCDDGTTFKGDENRDDQETLKDALDYANNNLNWVNP